MKINFLDYDFTDFLVKEGEFCGITAKLITAGVTTKFTQRNKIFRSSIWDLEGNLLSASYPKFVNWGENPEHFPVPTSLDNCSIIDKIDGSACIFDIINGKLSCRTRGTFSASQLDNATDFHYCIKKYPRIQEWLSKHSHNLTIICEIVTPNQKIILDYGKEPDLYLTGCIEKDTYRLFNQLQVDTVSEIIGVKRPKSYVANSIKDLMEFIAPAKDIEGCVIYSGEDQVLHKLKCERYLFLHRLKSEISSFDKVLDLYLEFNKPNEIDFYNIILTKFDFELATIAKDNINVACKWGEEAAKTLNEITDFLTTLNGLSRKEQAIKIITQFQPRGLQSFAFTLLNKKELDNKDWKKLIYILKDEIKQ